jgi:hypothetical protein
MLELTRASARKRGDVGHDVSGFRAGQRHARHHGVGIEQEVREPSGVEVPSLRDRRKRRSFACWSLLTSGYDVAGRTPAPRQRSSVIGIGGLYIATIDHGSDRQYHQ